jgi:hypothetical protein
MKINDIVLEQKLEESFWDKFKNYANKLGQSLATGQSLEQIERRAGQDRTVQLLIDAFLTQWDNMRYSLQQAYQKKGVRPDMYEEILDKLVYNQIKASIKSNDVKDAVRTLLANGDNLNSNSSRDAAYDIIISGIASQISPALGPKVDVLNRKLGKVEFGGPIPPGIPKEKGLIVPVIIVWDDASNQRLVKMGGQWFAMGAMKDNDDAAIVDYKDKRISVLNNTTLIKNQTVGNIDLLMNKKLFANDPSIGRKTALILDDPTLQIYIELDPSEIAAWQEQNRS